MKPFDMRRALHQERGQSGTDFYQKRKAFGAKIGGGGASWMKLPIRSGPGAVIAVGRGRQKRREAAGSGSF